ncbi:MAG: HEPN domain-containing protein [bacterium]
MKHLYDSGDYHWCLFMLHLVIEKLLKAYYVKYVGRNFPRIHDLLRLSELCGLSPDENQKTVLDRFTNFNIAARYPDFKDELYRLATKEFTSEQISAATELKKWLLNRL